MHWLIGDHEPPPELPANPVPISDIAALKVLSHGPLRQSEIAGRLGMVKSSASKLCVRLERDGWATRTPVPVPHGGNGFAYVLTLTEAGQQAAASLNGLERVDR